MLPIIEPVIDALTTLVRPFESAITAIISSAALPNVAFNNPPAPSPIRAPTPPSRAPSIRQRNNADGRANESAVGFSATGQNRITIAIGTNRSQLSDGFNFTMNSGSIADTKFGVGAAPAGAV
jgi:hypothetical protein